MLAKSLSASLVLFASLISTTALAQDVGKESGVQLGLRTGYGIPMGNAQKDAPLSDAYSGMIPIWLDAGYRFNPNIYAGAMFQYGFVSVKNCPTGADCSASNIRIGANLHYHIMPEATFDPWVGLGIGYEIMNSSAEMMGQKADGNAKGFEFANLQVGGDYKVMPDLGIGPFISFSLGQYSSAKVTAMGQTIDGDIKDKALHQWFVIGIRGAYNL